MTREEAIGILNLYDINFYDLDGRRIPAGKVAEAFDMAVEALRGHGERREQMGTNYYAVRRNRASAEMPIHIGKSSIGWMFHFQEQPFNYTPVEWHTYDQVIEWLKKHTVESNEYVIMDEYDEIVSLKDLVELIERKQEEYKDNPDNFRYGVKNVNGYRFSEREFW